MKAKLLKVAWLAIILLGLVIAGKETGPSWVVKAQEGVPPAPLAQGAQPLSQTDVLRMPPVDVEKLRQEDKLPG